MGVLTGNVEGLAWVKLESVDLKKYIDFGAFGSQAHVRSELVEIARQNAQKKFNKEFKTSDFVIIGDTPKDIQCAREAGIKVIAIATGKFSYKELEKENPDLLLESLEGNIEKVIDLLNNN
jgi:phosphoglycolate phosphatase-like HAD superfamily hydrolase